MDSGDIKLRTVHDAMIQILQPLILFSRRGLTVKVYEGFDLVILISLCLCAIFPTENTDLLRMVIIHA